MQDAWNWKSLWILVTGMCLAGWPTVPLPAMVICDVVFTDDNNDGPIWEGFVNTTDDSLTITSWKEQNSGTSYLITTGLPIVWPAVERTSETTSVPFDVPDNWDGTIGNNWGFLSPVSLAGMSFTNESNAVVNSTSTAVYMGWGIKDENSSLNSTTDQTHFGPVPTSVDKPTTANSAVVNIPQANVVVSACVTAVPEPSAWLYLTIVGIPFVYLRSSRFAS